MADMKAKGRAAAGARHGSVTSPGSLPTGERHHAIARPEVMSRGDSHYSRRYPEKLARGENNGSSKLNAVSVREILRRHSNGEALSSIAKEFNVTKQAIHFIVKRITWKHIPEG